MLFLKPLCTPEHTRFDIELAKIPNSIEYGIIPNLMSNRVSYLICSKIGYLTKFTRFSPLFTSRSSKATH